MSKKDDYTNDMLIADALLRLKAIENLLISKGVFTREEFSAEMDSITHEIAKALLQKANVPGDLDEILKSIKSNVGN